MSVAVLGMAVVVAVVRVVVPHVVACGREREGWAGEGRSEAGWVAAVVVARVVAGKK